MSWKWRKKVINEPQVLQKTKKKRGLWWVIKVCPIAKKGNYQGAMQLMEASEPFERLDASYKFVFIVWVGPL